MTKFLLTLAATAILATPVWADETEESVNNETHAVETETALDQESLLEVLDLEAQQIRDASPDWYRPPGHRPPRPWRPRPPGHYPPHHPGYPPYDNHYGQPQYPPYDNHYGQPQYPQHPHNPYRPPRPPRPNFPPPPPPPPFPHHPPVHHGPVSIDCNSIKYRDAYCPAPRPFSTAWLAVQHSNNKGPCILGQTWGFDGRGIWVKNGCRGTFNIQ